MVYQSLASSELQLDRVIRVFISSTFRDMMADRDYLVKFTFPQLRRLCESRGVVWGDVDLRWGVTDEQKAEGKVLPIVLEEIGRCRPYFIGLLGERYGLPYESFSEEIIERESWMKEYADGKTSLTEIEVLHGVLRDPSMADHAFFYFRDPNYLNHLPAGSNRSDFVSEDPVSQRRLATLKQSVRNSQVSYHENYADPKALGDLVLNDLTEVIDKLFPQGSKPDPLDQEAFEHEAYARSRREVYIGREEYFTRLTGYVDGEGDKPLVVLGESGSGKSALLANWVARYRELHPDVMILQHYIGATPQSADWTQIVLRILNELKRNFGFQEEVPVRPEGLRSTFANWLYMTTARGKVVLVLDALNQLEDREGAPDLLWLPPRLPNSVKLVLSTLPGRSLMEATVRSWPTMSVEPLTYEERKRLIEQFLARHAKALNAAQIETIASGPRSSTPIFLRVLLDELRQFGQHDRLEQRINYYLNACSASELYTRVIERWDEDFGAHIDLVHRSLSAIWSSRHGLSESELLEILGTEGQPLPQALWSPFFLAMSDSLICRGGLLIFAHDFLRQATSLVCVSNREKQQAVHVRLADYFESQPMGSRKSQELPWQLMQGAAWGRLFNLLTDAEFSKMLWSLNEFDVRRYWAEIESNSSFNLIDAHKHHIARPEQMADSDLLFIVAALLYSSGHIEQSYCIHSHLTSRYRIEGETSRLARCLGYMAKTEFERGNLERALTLHSEELEICNRIGDIVGAIISIGNQALTVEALGDLTIAMNLHKQEEALCRQVGDLARLQVSIGNQAYLLIRSKGDLNEATDLLREMENICRQIGHQTGLHICLGNRGAILKLLGDLEGAFKMMHEKELICRQLGSIKGIAIALSGKSEVLAMMGRKEEALELIERALQLANDNGLRFLTERRLVPIRHQISHSDEDRLRT